MSEKQDLMLAIESSDIEKIKLLLNENNDTKFINEPIFNNLIAQYFQDHLGVLESAVSEQILDNYENFNLCSPLMLAAFQGKIEVVNCLLDAGADVDFMNGFGFNALMLAAFQGKIEVVNCLLAANADVNFMNKDKFKSLMDVAQNRNSALVFKEFSDQESDIECIEELVKQCDDIFNIKKVLEQVLKIKSLCENLKNDLYEKIMKKETFLKKLKSFLNFQQKKN